MFEVEVNATSTREPTLIHVITTAPTAASSPTDTGSPLRLLRSSVTQANGGCNAARLERLERVLMDFTVEQMKDSAPAAETPFLLYRNLGKYQDHHNCMLYFSCDNKFMMNKDRYFMGFFFLPSQQEE